MDGPYADRRGACSFELRRHGRQKFRAAVIRKRRGQFEQVSLFVVAEAERHGRRLRKTGDLGAGDRRIDGRLQIGIFAQCPLRWFPRRFPAPFWGVVRSLPRRERFAAERVEALGYPVFLPLVQTQRASAPLFSGYFFCRIVDRWRSINSTLGVLCLVRVGDCSARCPDHEIAALKAMTVGGFVRLPEATAAPARPKIAIGARVRITAGPFGGMNGLYSGQTTRERELVLLNVLGGQRPVAIAANLVAPL